MDSAELSEWLAYHQLEPIPDPNWHTGLIASLMVNLWSKSKTRPEDFIPRARRLKSRPVQTPAEQLARFQALAAAHNARIAPRKV